MADLYDGAPIVSFAEAPLDRRATPVLNTIVEETEDDEASPIFHQAEQKIKHWLSPMSDHFPTPRGFHFLAAPIVPSESASVTSRSESNALSSLYHQDVDTMSECLSVADTEGTEFDDLNIPDDEDLECPKPPPQLREQAPALARLIIPTKRAISESLSANPDKKSFESSMQMLSATSELQRMSPEACEFMMRQEFDSVRDMSTPPSLDGSLDSINVPLNSAPPTPILTGADENLGSPIWVGVQLEPGALDTLRCLGDSHGQDLGDLLDDDQLPEVVTQTSPEPMREMSQRRSNFLLPSLSIKSLSTSGTFHAEDLGNDEIIESPTEELTSLDVPSPESFFSHLEHGARNTWRQDSRCQVVSPQFAVPESFYRTAWRDTINAEGGSGNPVEQVVDALYHSSDDDAMSTARPPVTALLGNKSPVTATRMPKEFVSDAETSDPESLKEGDVKILLKYAVAAPGTEQAPVQQELRDEERPVVGANRTEMWLNAQTAYLPVANSQQVEAAKVPRSESKLKLETCSKLIPITEPILQSAAKKSVRFSDLFAANQKPCRLPSTLVRSESAFYRAFQEYTIRYSASDVFVNRLTRFEALQAQRSALPEQHRNQLLGKFQLGVVPQSMKKRMSANVARGDDELVVDPRKIRREREYEAMSQMAMSIWHVAAVKQLQGGRLICAPVAERLARIGRGSTMTAHGLVRERARILDLGGYATCDWAWHVAHQYPSVRVYTVTTSAIRQMANANIKGPLNHRLVAVDTLARLPFDDNQFDLVSAREVHSLLKVVGHNGVDEWDACLQECYRVLKPGGYLDFSILDSDLVNTGPLANSKSVEFGFALKTLGYDPTPTRSFLGRLSRGGFTNVRRVWTVLPVGERPTPKQKAFAQPTSTVVVPDAEATGSTNNVASICSLAAGWSWERWLLRCETEKLAGDLRLADTTTTTSPVVQAAGKCLEGVARLVEEGRQCGAAWRMLQGYARKPRLVSKLSSQTIAVRLA